MMAYDKGYVVSVMHQGSPVREINRTVHLPFGSEYKVRLKNKNNHRAKARVFIDGTLVSNFGDLIVNANSTLDLERFLDSSLDSGNRFKFVPLSNSKVNDPSSTENGIIKVEFYSEKLPDFSWHMRKLINTNPRTYTGDNVDWFYNPNLFNSTTISTTNKLSYTNEPVACVFNSTEGATVEGTVSRQKFQYGNGFETEEVPLVIQLKIRGIGTHYESSKKKKVKFCSHCGKRKVGVSDAFCGRCGNKY